MTEPNEKRLTWRDYGINSARHSTNCVVHLKTWAAENPEAKCDCELGELYRRVGKWEQTA